MMDISVLVPSILTVVGLVIFEIISGADNAVVGSGVLATIRSQRERMYFLIFGGFFAVLVVRGVLPFVIFATASPDMSLADAWHAMWNSDPAVQKAVEKSAPILLSGGGIFLVMLTLHWLFVEDKEHFGFRLLESRCLAIGQSWFHAVSFGTIVIVLFLIKRNMDPEMAASVMLSTSIGGLMFFIVQGFKDNAERAEHDLMSEGGSQRSDRAKVVFLTFIDATFSIDSVVGAFAFTMSVPLILIGNGIGAIVVMYLTVRNTDRIQSLVYLKTGAMYSIGILGVVMLYEAFGHHVPEWISPTITIGLISYFFWRSVQHNRKNDQMLQAAA